MRSMLLLVLFECCLVLFFGGCAGPTTPLGAPWATTSSEVRNGPLSFITSLFRSTASGPQLDFQPAHQVLHGPSPISVTIHDPSAIKTNFKLVVRHNGMDVTASFLRQAEIIRKDEHEVTIRVPRIRLSPVKDHLIE